MNELVGSKINIDSQSSSKSSVSSYPALVISTLPDLYPMNAHVMMITITTPNNMAITSPASALAGCTNPNKHKTHNHCKIDLDSIFYVLLVRYQKTLEQRDYSMEDLPF